MYSQIQSSVWFLYFLFGAGLASHVVLGVEVEELEAVVGAEGDVAIVLGAAALALIAGFPDGLVDLLADFASRCEE